jgi:hypothetical protein
MTKRSIVQSGRFAGTYGSLISQEELDRITPKASEPGYVDPNPCVKLFGKGPEGKTCKGCKHLTRMLYGHTVLKCDERTDLTHGKATDQKAGWNACNRFEEGENRRYYQSH